MRQLQLPGRLCAGQASGMFRRGQTTQQIGRGHLCALIALTILLALPAISFAEQPVGQSSRQAREHAIAAIPFNDLTPEVHEKVWSVVSNPSVFRRLPSETIECDPQLHVFLIRHPEVVVNMWQLMGITKVEVKRTGDYTFSATDGAGTFSDVELIYGTPNLHLYYATGYYEGALLRNRIEGACVMMLRSEYSQQSGHQMVTNHLDFFVRMDHAGADLLAKTLHPLMGKSADHNFAESTKFISQVSQATEINGPGMQRLAERLNNIDPKVRDSFVKHTETIYQQAVLRGSIEQTPLPSDLPTTITTARSVSQPAIDVVREPIEPPYAMPATRPIFRR